MKKKTTIKVGVIALISIAILFFVFMNSKNLSIQNKNGDSDIYHIPEYFTGIENSNDLQYVMMVLPYEPALSFRHILSDYYWSGLVEIFIEINGSEIKSSLVCLVDGQDSITKEYVLEADITNDIIKNIVFQAELNNGRLIEGEFKKVNIGEATESNVQSTYENAKTSNCESLLGENIYY